MKWPRPRGEIPAAAVFCEGGKWLAVAACAAACGFLFGAVAALGFGDLLGGRAFFLRGFASGGIASGGLFAGRARGGASGALAAGIGGFFGGGLVVGGGVFFRVFDVRVFFGAAGFTLFAFADIEADGEALVGHLGADGVFEVAPVGWGHETLVIDEEDETRGDDGALFFFAGESGVEEFEAFAADGWRRGAGDGFLEEAVEGTGAELGVAGGADLVDGSEDFAETVAGFGGDGDEGCVVEEEEFATDVGFEFLETGLHFAVWVVEVEFIGDDEAGFVFFDDDGGDFAFLGGDAAGGVDDEGDDVGAADAAFGAADGVGFDGVIDLGLTADAGGVHEEEGVAAVIVEGVDGVASGAGDFADNGAFVVEDGVEEGGFADVGAADDGEADAARVGVGVVVFGVGIGWFGGWAEGGFDGVDELGDAPAVFCAEAADGFEAEACEVCGDEVVFGVVGFIDAEDDWFALAAELFGDALVDGVHAGEGVDDEDDEVGGGDGDVCFGADDGAEVVVEGGSDAAGVHDGDGEGSVFETGGEAVAGDAGSVVDDGDAAAGEAVEEGGFADIGAADDGDDAVAAGEDGA